MPTSLRGSSARFRGSAQRKRRGGLSCRDRRASSRACVRREREALTEEIELRLERDVRIRVPLVALRAPALREAHRHAISRVLETCPGLGPIRVAQLIPIVVTPTRFRTERQFWSYCGLGIVMRSSSDWTRTKDGGWVRANVQSTCGLNLNHNHALKNVFKGAATTVVTQLDTDPLHAHYKRLTEGGTKPNLAKLTLARKIAAIALSMWKTKERYDPTKHKS